MIIPIVGLTLHGVRWWILLRAFNPGITLSRALSFHFIGAFYGSAIPSNMGQDVIKTVLVAHKGSASKSWAALWLTRIMSLPAIGIFSAYGFFTMDKSALPKGATAGGALFYTFVFILFFLSFSKRMTGPIRKKIEKSLHGKVLDTGRGHQRKHLSVQEPEIDGRTLFRRYLARASPARYRGRRALEGDCRSILSPAMFCLYSAHRIGRRIGPVYPERHGNQGGACGRNVRIPAPFKRAARYLRPVFPVFFSCPSDHRWGPICFIQLLEKTGA